MTSLSVHGGVHSQALPEPAPQRPVFVIPLVPTSYAYADDGNVFLSFLNKGENLNGSPCGP
jgi:hypothetical protein